MTEILTYYGSYGPFYHDDTDTYSATDDDGDAIFGDGATMDAIVTSGAIASAVCKLWDTDLSHTLGIKWNENDSGDRVLNFLVGGGDRSITLNENFTIGDGTNITITGVTAARTITLNENLTIGDGTDITITGVTAARTFTMNENFTIGDGNDGTLTYSAASKTLTVNDDVTVPQTLNSIINPDGDKTFNMTTRQLAFLWTNPSGNPLELRSGGAYSGSILHVHQESGNPSSGTHLISIESADTDVMHIHSTGPATTTHVFCTYVSGDSDMRSIKYCDGKLAWGDGTNPVDTNLYRSSANVLKTDDAFEAASCTLAGNLALEGASVTVGKASTTTGTIVLHDSNSANTITLTVPDISAGSLTFTLPPTDGDNTNLLQTNGSGVLTWTAAGAGDVTAAAALTDHLIVRGDAAAKAVQTSGITLDDSNNLSGVGTIGCGTVTSTGNVVIADAGNIGSASDTDAIAISAAGIIDLTAQSGCTVKLSHDDDIAPGSPVQMEFDTEEDDVQNEFNISTYTFTAAADGKYQVSLTGYTVEALGDGKLFRIYIYKNAAGWTRVLAYGGAAGAAAINVSARMDLTATDTVSAYVYHSHTENRQISSALCVFSIAKIA